MRINLTNNEKETKEMTNEEIMVADSNQIEFEAREDHDKIVNEVLG
mgnify:FL=1